MTDPIRWEQADDRESVYYLGVSDALALLERQGTIAPAQRAAAYRQAAAFAAALAVEDDDREDASEPGPCAVCGKPDAACRCDLPPAF